MKAKSLDIKLAKIKANPACGEFILADAKDADMAFGISAPGKSPEYHSQEGRFRTLEEYRECIRQVVRQGLVDIMLMSAHTSSVLTIGERLFDNSHVTPAARANDTTDIFAARGSIYATHPSEPFRTATIDHIQCGRVECDEQARATGANLGLYSVTFNNDLEADKRTLEAYRLFRIEAEQKGFRHFLEVFDPNAPRNNLAPEKLGGFVNDMIVRCLAGVPEAGRPLFLKMVYHGPKFTEELARYDPSLVIGILGGSSGTTYDAFKLISEAQKYGARIALFGRKINNAENQLAFVEMLRRIVDGQISPEEAVRAYHGILQGLRLRPYRPLEEDLKLTTQVMSYGGSTQAAVPAPPPAAPVASPPRPVAPASVASPLPATIAEVPRPAAPPAKSAPGGHAKVAASIPSPPDFSRMTPDERLAYHRNRLKGLA